MAHTIRDKQALLARVRRLQGQLRAVERALEEERGCGDVLHRIAAVRGAANGLMAEVLEEHLRAHVVADASETLDDVVGVVRSYLR